MGGPNTARQPDDDFSHDVNLMTPKMLESMDFVYLDSFDLSDSTQRNSFFDSIENLTMSRHEVHTIRSGDVAQIWAKEITVKQTRDDVVRLVGKIYGEKKRKSDRPPRKSN